MTRALPLAALVAASASAQTGDATLAPTADQFRDDLRVVTHLVATTALVHDATGAFPDTPFALLGSRQATRTELRAVPLSDLGVEAGPDRVTYTYVPLPTDPYVRTDDVISLTVTRNADGTYAGDYEIVRREAPADGGERIAYDRAGRYYVTRGFGTACVDVATVEAQLAAGTFAPEPGTLGPEPLTVQVRPVGEAAPVLYHEQ